MSNISLYLDQLNIYEVEKEDYDSYFFRLPKDELIKTTPLKNLVIWKDTKDNVPVCGKEVEEILGQKCTRFFIFNILPEDRLGAHKVTKYITLKEEEYLDFIKKMVGRKN